MKINYHDCVICRGSASAIRVHQCSAFSLSLPFSLHLTPSLSSSHSVSIAYTAMINLVYFTISLWDVIIGPLNWLLRALDSRILTLIPPLWPKNPNRPIQESGSCMKYTVVMKYLRFFISFFTVLQSFFFFCIIFLSLSLYRLMTHCIQFYFHLNLMFSVTNFSILCAIIIFFYII